ncbi:hypothetical protein B5G12_08055 [Faecalibacterium sp. An58]|uniref:hypothetical protein n=1 Tax=Faecalibacterium sp. An58 TaxID=1965648 RepID=UPI000B57F73C|nr:hypothetical protein [Faecalibacterium sp. An58]OUN72900.1 hypothetical protein B5G12_08055 [Faecalibacterium sp. An58]
MELFREDGCLTDEGLQALVEGSLDEWGRLEAAEHLSYCDRCMDRYTALLTGAVLEQPPRDLSRPVSRAILIRLMQNVYGRMAVAGVAAVLALTIWRSGSLGLILAQGDPLETYTPQQIDPPASTVVPKPKNDPPPRPGEEGGIAQKAYQAVTGLWNTLTGPDSGPQTTN